MHTERFDWHSPTLTAANRSVASNARSIAWLVTALAVAALIVPMIAHAAEDGVAPEMPRSGLLSAGAAAFLSLWEVLGPIVAAVPTIPSELWRTAHRIAASSTGGIGLDLGTTITCVALVLGLAAFARRLAARDVALAVGRDPLLAIVRRFGFDVLAILGILALAILLAEIVFSANNAATALCAAILDAVVRFRLAMMVPGILFRPDEPHLRLMPASETQVTAGKPYFLAALAAGLGFPTLIPVWLAAGMGWPASQALAVIVGPIVAWLGYVAVAKFFAAQAETWRDWRPLVRLVAIGFALVWSYGVVTLNFPLFFALVSLGTIFIVALILDRFVAVALRLAAGAGEGAHYLFWRDYGSALRRALHVLAVSASAIVVAGFVAEVSPMLFGTWHMANFQHGLLSALAAFATGYMLFELLMAWTRSRFAPPTVAALPGNDENEEPEPASRLTTVMPLLQGFLGVLILGVSVLVALNKLGVDTTPLLAGAGIFGLAISFGSQSLVRDIVAGIFYMADDAFRLGEYIEAGRLKGAVEKISLRSVRLRHSNGQIHTVPFGQLGSVTNFSRDWVTMKFNLRLARDIDIDFVRKTVKKIGLELLEDEEVGKEFLQPLKMQGVADILENALVLRFKFTVKPGKPTYIQRIAMKRIVNTFAEKGISFATHSLMIQNAGEAEPDVEDIAAHPLTARMAGIAPRGAG